jgi:DNA replication protein DnaC
VRHHEHIFVLGPTGVGKSYVASALAQKACRDGYSVYYSRTAALFRDPNLARADLSLRQLLKRLNRIDVLVIDDWAMAPMSEAERRDFWEIAEDRYQARSMILTSQLPVSRWHEQIGDPTPGRQHPRPLGAQRSSHRDARRVHAQKTQSPAG